MSEFGLLNQPTLVWIVILNYRTPQLTFECLSSVIDEVKSRSDVQIAVVDNASNDGSVEHLTAAIALEGWEDRVTLLPLDYNGGYGFGNNAAIRLALQSPHPPSYIWLLNPDTLVLSGALSHLIEFMNENPQVGIAGSRLEDGDGTPQHSAFRFHTILSELDSGLQLGIVSRLLSRWIVAPPIPDHPCQTQWVPGASMMIRREVFEAIGLLDEDYFMYFEDNDFCLHAQRAGWGCWYVPQSRVIHWRGQSSGITDTKRPPQRRPQYWFEARQRYFIKNYGLVYAIAADLAWLGGFFLWQGRRFVQRKPNPYPPQFLQDFVRNSLLIRPLLKTQNKWLTVDC